MSSQTVTMPQLGESVVEGVVVQWLVQVGQEVGVDDPLCEIETDKANTEVPSPVAGFVTRLYAELEDVVGVGQPLVDLSSEKPEGVVEPAAGSVATPPAATPTAPPAVARPSSAVAPPSRAATPTFAPAAPATALRPSPPPRPQPDRWTPFGHPENARAYRYPQPRVDEGDTVEKFSRRRKIISEHMVVSQAVSPHVVTVAEVDMTNAWRLRDQHKARLKAQGIGLTFLSFILKATVEALREYPSLNAVVGDGEVIMKGRINLGCAVETPEGLVVPVIRDADQLTLVGLAKAVTRLAGRARDGKLEPDDVSGGTFTVSNPGRKGNLYGGAIINQPQVGIVRMGEIKKRPMVISKGGDDVIAIRNMMYLALSYDHRVVDGVTGNSFLFRIRELLDAAQFQT
jgi:2-oxoglutarate dehydrogenase E2 component (dihydrolipoamide succinyltransferase)